MNEKQQQPAIMERDQTIAYKSFNDNNDAIMVTPTKFNQHEL